MCQPLYVSCCTILLWFLKYWCRLVAKLYPTLLWPYGLWPARLLCPRDSPGKSTGMDCHFLLQNEAEQRLIEFFQENTLVIANTLFQQHKRRLCTWTSPDDQHWNQIDYIIWVKDGEALYSQQKQDWELTVAQIMNALLPNSDLNWRKWGKPLDHSGMT